MKAIAVVVSTLFGLSMPPALAQTRPSPPPEPVIDRVVASPADGVWSGTSDAATCPALGVKLEIEGGVVVGVASEPDTGQAKVVGKKGEQLPAPPALWQLHGRVGADGAMRLSGLRAMRGRERESVKWTGKIDGGTAMVVEADGACRRAAALRRSR